MKKQAKVTRAKTRCQKLVEANPPIAAASSFAHSVWLYFNGSPVKASPRNAINRTVWPMRWNSGKRT